MREGAHPLDEAWTWSQEHFRATNASWCRLRPSKADNSETDESILFDGIRVAFFGDPCQHDPPGANNTRLCSGALDTTAEEKAERAASLMKNGTSRAYAVAGRALYEQATSFVFELTSQHRIARDDADGQRLYKYSRLFNRDNVTHGEMEEFIDAINERAVPSLVDIIDENPHVAVLRHKLRSDINMRIVKVRRYLCTKLIPIAQCRVCDVS